MTIAFGVLFGFMTAIASVALFFAWTGVKVNRELAGVNIGLHRQLERSQGETFALRDYLREHVGIEVAFEWREDGDLQVNVFDLAAGDADATEMEAALNFARPSGGKKARAH